MKKGIQVFNKSYWQIEKQTIFNDVTESYHKLNIIFL